MSSFESRGSNSNVPKWVRDGIVGLASLFFVGTFGARAALTPWEEGDGFRSREVRPVGSGKVGFTSMDPGHTGVGFTNLLAGDAYLTNFVAHNGAGVAVGDIDADGLPDLYFANLQGPNRMYRNLGDWRFAEMEAGEAACADQLSTGVVFADVDGDGDLDLLVNGIAVGTRLFLNDGKGGWSEAKDSGLSRTASATSSTLADIDGDGDLDLYCAHFIDAMLLADPTSRFAIARKGDQWEVTKFNGESTRSPKWKGRFEALPGGKVRELPEVHGLYRNEGRGRFRAIEFEPGTYLDAKGGPMPPYRDWGLAAVFRDLDRDGNPDLYVCNDNTSPDRIWINTGQGTFRALEATAIRHTSRSSMGIDVGDVDRDGFDDLMVVDMLARDHARRMTQLVRDRPPQAETEAADFRPQYNRNTLFFGRADGTYVEAAFLAGVAATDWTWSPILMDVDLDGFEDLLVTNGFEFDVMDQDSDDRIRDPRQRLTEAQLKRSMQFRPPFRTRNAAFRNRGDGTFEPAGERWGFDRAGVSFGMAQGDLDGDGDLDLVVNNLNEVASLYRNDGSAPRLGVRLKGLPGNIAGVGARIRWTGGKVAQSQEMICGGRYLSGDEAMRSFAAEATSTSATAATARLEVRWRDGSVSTVAPVRPNRCYEIRQTPGGRRAPESKPVPPTPDFEDVSTALDHHHVEDAFDDWERQPMLPRRLSRLGPGVGWMDLDGDGWEDLVVGSGRGGRLTAFRNLEGRGFRKQEAPVAAAGDWGAVLGWADGQGHRRLLVAHSEPPGAPEATSEVLILDPASLEVVGRLPLGEVSPGPLSSADIDGDGDLDLFVGGRYRPGRYPEPVPSSVWLNQDGRLTRDEAWSRPFAAAGLVSGAVFFDADGDGMLDLALTTEWGPVRLLLHRGGTFEDATAAWGLAEATGWWTGVAAGDFDGDGRVDLACGNWGRNSVYELHRPTVIRLYYGDWNSEGVVRMIEAWGSGTEWFPVHDRTWLARGFPELPIRFPTHQGFAMASLREILGAAYAESRFHQAARLESCVFLNRGRWFEIVALPRDVQLAPVFGMGVADVDGDGQDDLFSSQNFFGTVSDLSREDNGRGALSRGDGRGAFRAVDTWVSGIRLLGEGRGAAMADFDHDGRWDLAVGQNGGPTKLLRNRGAKPGLRVVLEGTRANPDAIGAQVRLIYPGGRRGPCRTVGAGSGYWSQDAATPLLGRLETPESVWVRWPGGRETTVRVDGNATTVRIACEPR